MTNEKELGRIVDDAYDIVSADDLLHLQSDEPWDIEFAAGCTCCTCSCHTGTTAME